MLLTIVILLAGLVVLILGGDFLVRGASNIALRLKLSPLVVGLTIVAFGTSAPELLISVKAALSGSPDLTMGNVVGSNICNLALVMGVTAMIFPIKVGINSIKIDWPMTMGSSILLFLLVREGWVEYYEGILFVAILIIYLVFIIRKSRKDNNALLSIEGELIQPEPGAKSQWKDGGYILLGIVGLFFGAEWFVGAAQTLAKELGVAERVIGITVLALGTSLPELATSAMAAWKKQTDIALGNLLGSNIFNILSILGITSIIKDIEVSPAIFKVDMVWMLAITFILLPMMIFQKDINRWEGGLLFTIYLVYTYTVLM